MDSGDPRQIQTTPQHPNKPQRPRKPQPPNRRKPQPPKPKPNKSRKQISRKSNLPRTQNRIIPQQQHKRTKLPKKNVLRIPMKKPDPEKSDIIKAKCRQCNNAEIEDIHHFITQCPKFKDQRFEFRNRLKKISKVFINDEIFNDESYLLFPYKLRLKPKNQGRIWKELLTYIRKTERFELFWNNKENPSGSPINSPPND